LNPYKTSSINDHPILSNLEGDWLGYVRIAGILPENEQDINGNDIINIEQDEQIIAISCLSRRDSKNYPMIMVKPPENKEEARIVILNYEIHKPETANVYYKKYITILFNSIYWATKYNEMKTSLKFKDNLLQFGNNHYQDLNMFFQK
jgi:hypothetical protein